LNGKGSRLFVFDAKLLTFDEIILYCNRRR
jgi:hypothetical protein